MLRRLLTLRSGWFHFASSLRTHRLSPCGSWAEAALWRRRCSNVRRETLEPFLEHRNRDAMCLQRYSKSSGISIASMREFDLR